MKYIVATTKFLGVEDRTVSCVFSESFIHAEMAKSMERQLFRNGHREFKVVGAGFVEFDGNANGVECFGKSESLGIDSRYDDDANVIRDEVTMRIQFEVGDVIYCGRTYGEVGARIIELRTNGAICQSHREKLDGTNSFCGYREIVPDRGTMRKATILREA